MKLKIFLLVIVCIILSLLITNKVLSAKTPDPVGLFCVEPSYVPPPPPPKPDPLEVYLDKLAMCESGNNPKAVNPMDVDGTPSLGRYQFKQSTFNNFSALYGFATTTENHSIWNGDEQRDIVRIMAKTLSRKEWARQFPDCTLNKVGYPPTMSATTTPKVGG